MRATSEVEAMTGATHEPCSVTLFKTSREDNLLRRARGEFREMPGMRLTVDQAISLWMIDRTTCTSLFDSLVAARFLELDRNGRYRKIQSGCSNGEIKDRTDCRGQRHRERAPESDPQGGVDGGRAADLRR